MKITIAVHCCEQCSSSVTRVFRGILNVIENSTRSLPKIAEDNQTFPKALKDQPSPSENLLLSHEHFQTLSTVTRTLPNIFKEFKRISSERVLRINRRSIEDFSTPLEALGIFRESLGMYLEDQGHCRLLKFGLFNRTLF